MVAANTITAAVDARYDLVPATGLDRSRALLAMSAVFAWAARLFEE